MTLRNLLHAFMESLTVKHIQHFILSDTWYETLVAVAKNEYKLINPLATQILSTQVTFGFSTTI